MKASPIASAVKIPIAMIGVLFTLISHAEEVDILPAISPNYTVVPLYASSWVDPRRFQPLPRAARDVDLIMVANFAKFKRHFALFGALRQLPRNRRAVRPLLRLLRPRDGARSQPADVVAALVPRGADPAGRGLDLWDRAGATPPLNHTARIRHVWCQTRL